MTATLTVGEPTGIDDTRLPALTSHPSAQTTHPSPQTAHPTPQTYDLQGRQAVGGKGIVIREGRKYVRP